MSLYVTNVWLHYLHINSSHPKFEVIVNVNRLYYEESCNKVNIRLYCNSIMSNEFKIHKKRMQRIIM